MTIPQTRPPGVRVTALPDQSAVRMRGVSRCYGGRRVLGPVDLELEPGGVCLVEGPNGSGKTTLLRVAAGLLEPTSGVVEATGSALYLAAGGGARPEQPVHRALGWVESVAQGRGVPVAAALELAGLATCARARVGALSAGQRARLSLALALVAGPGLACLDEPTAHLDAAGVDQAAAVVAALAAAGCAVLVATPDAGHLVGAADARVRLEVGRAERVP